jgi:hypothetical protein
MLLAFFDIKGLVYTLIMPIGTTINTNYILVVLGKFMDEICSRVVKASVLKSQ